MPFNIADLDPEVQDFIVGLQTDLEESDAALQDTVTKATAWQAELTTLRASASADAVRKAGDDDAAFEAAIAKAEPATAEFMKMQRQANKDLQERLQKQEAQDHQRTMVAKAQALPFIPGSDAEKAELFSKMYSVRVDVTKDDGTTESKPIGELVETVFKAVNAQLESASIFTEIGNTGATLTNSTAIDAKAAEFRKADPTLTQEQAIAKAYEEDPNAYVAAQNEIEARQRAQQGV